MMPHDGPWRIRWTRPNGETGVGEVTYSTYAEAAMWARRARDACREGCTYDPVPDTGD